VVVCCRCKDTLLKGGFKSLSGNLQGSLSLRNRCQQMFG
jgi:hypothetical protein